MATWSPTSLFNRRAYGPENLSPTPQKDFCNTIPSTADIVTVRRHVAKVPEADISGVLDGDAGLPATAEGF
jgi:hypothetical protein